MLDLIGTAKCGLLDNVFAGTFWMPMMPTVIAVTAFVLGHGAGRALGHFTGLRPVRPDTLWPTVRIALAALAVLIVVAVAARGIVYPLFLARMVKDAYYCSYFETTRDLQAAHWIVFAMMFIAHLCCVAFFDDRRLRALDSLWLQATSLAAYVALGVVGYVMAVSLDATVVPLTVLFILPFVYCGIGLLARQR